MSPDRKAQDLIGLSLTLDEALALAEQHLQAGRLPAAETICRDILRDRPNCAAALHLLGIALYRAGNLPSAIDLVRRATLSDGSVALYHCNLCEMYRLAGERDLAGSLGTRTVSRSTKPSARCVLKAQVRLAVRFTGPPRDGGAIIRSISSR